MARKGLGRLESAGLIKRGTAQDIETENLITLTRAGVRFVEEAIGFRIPQARKIDYATLAHDACVTAVRLRLEELWDGYWIPEALLKAEEFPQIPDGLWVFPNGNRVAIEVERTSKGDTRFHRLQERWRDVEVRLVLYIAVDSSTHGRVRRYLETGPKDLPFGLVPLDELEAGTPPVWTHIKEVDLFCRRSF